MQDDTQGARADTRGELEAARRAIAESVSEGISDGAVRRLASNAAAIGFDAGMEWMLAQVEARTAAQAAPDGGITLTQLLMNARAAVGEWMHLQEEKFPESVDGWLLAQQLDEAIARRQLGAGGAA